MHASGSMESPPESARRRAAHCGQALLIFAVASVALVGMMAMAVDAGYLLGQRRGVQSAADAAALAADKAVQRNQGGAVVATGLGYAAANGYANGGANTVTINRPPSSGSRAGDNVCVEAIISHQAAKFFVGAVYSGPWQTQARGVACAEPTSRPYALIALKPNGSGLTAGGSAELQINNGGAFTNNVVNICGTASWIQADGPLDAVSGITVCPNADVVAETMNGTSPPLADPLAGVAPPTAAECGTTRPNPNIRNADPSPITLQPGNYVAGITISGNNKVINFAPGVYCFGGDLKVNGGSSGNVLKGSPVLFYFSGNARFNVDGGGNDVQLKSGPGTSCTTAACSAKIVIYYDRANCQDLWLVGGNGTNVNGIIYAPCSLIHLGGGSGSQITGQVLGGDVTLVGGAALTINYQEYVVTAIPLVYLVE